VIEEGKATEFEAKIRKLFGRKAQHGTFEEKLYGYQYKNAVTEKPPQESRKSPHTPLPRGRMAPRGARPSTGPEKRSAPRAGQRLAA
jgi:hypothetical protein